MGEGLWVKRGRREEGRVFFVWVYGMDGMRGEVFAVAEGVCGGGGMFYVLCVCVRWNEL